MRQDDVTAAYDACAANYDTHGVPFFSTIARRLVDEAGLGPASNVLDAGCGAGAVTIPAARVAKHVTGIDLSRKMLARAYLAAAAMDLRNVTVALADAHDPPCMPGSFDAVLASMLMFLLHDPAAAARAWLHLLRPGGTIGFSWIIAEDPRWVPVISVIDELVPGGTGFAELCHRPPFAAIDDVEAMITNSGYSHVTTTEATVPRRYTGPRQWWASSWTQAPSLVWQTIPEDLRAAGRDEAFRHLERMREPDGSLIRETVIGYTFARRA
jgi:O-methyltransferase/aklanonic acid methyltransferase